MLTKAKQVSTSNPKSQVISQFTTASLQEYCELALLLSTYHIHSDTGNVIL